MVRFSKLCNVSVRRPPLAKKRQLARGEGGLISRPLGKAGVRACLNEVAIQTFIECKN